MRNRCVLLAEVNTRPEDARAEIALKIVSAYIERVRVAEKKKYNIKEHLWLSLKSNKLFSLCCGFKKVPI